MNQEKADALLAWLKENKARWYQGHWTNIPVEYELGDDPYWPTGQYRYFGKPKVKVEEGHTVNCGTTGCVAGHAGFMFGPVNTQYFREAMLLPTGRALSYQEFAAETLELTKEEAEYLFHGDRSFDQIEKFLTANTATRLSIMYSNDWDDRKECSTM